MQPSQWLVVAKPQFIIPIFLEQVKIPSVSVDIIMELLQFQCLLSATSPSVDQSALSGFGGSHSIERQ